MSKTKIEWADAVWNPITGCSPISEGCDHCYARRMANRLKGRYGYPADDPFRVTFHENRLYEAINRLKPSRIFVCSMSDIGHPAVKASWFHSIMGIIESNPESVYMMLTKRPAELLRKIEVLGRIPYNQRDIDDFECYWKEKLPLKNLWIGVTAENQQRADERIPILLQIPAAVRFVSVEPMLGPVDFEGGDTYPEKGFLRGWHVEPKHHPSCDGVCESCPIPVQVENAGEIDWVIAGGETGPGARPMHPDWVRSLRDQCVASGVPFFFKGFGAWRKSESQYVFDAWMHTNGNTFGPVDGEKFRPEKSAIPVLRVDKKAAGRILDGREWNEFPAPPSIG